MGNGQQTQRAPIVVGSPSVANVPESDMGATNSQNLRATAAHVIDSGGWETGEEPAWWSWDKTKEREAEVMEP